MPKILSVEDVDNLNDPAPSWRWVVRLPDIPTSMGKNLEGLEERASSVTFGLVTDIEFSVRQIDADQRFGAGGVLNYPRQRSISNVSITMLEDVKYSCTKYMRSWQNLVMDEDNNYGLPKDYKHDIHLFAFDYTSNTSPIITGKLIGCWPLTFSGLNYNYTNSGYVSIVGDFAVDEDVIEFSSGFKFGFGDDDSPLGQLRQFTQSVRAGVSQVRETIRNVTAPIRDAVSFVRETINTGREVLDAGRGIVNEVRNTTRQVTGIVDEVRGFGSEVRGAGRSLINAPREISNDLLGGFGGMSRRNGIGISLIR
jgi:hypothetical protein